MRFCNSFLAVQQFGDLRNRLTTERLGVEIQLPIALCSVLPSQKLEKIALPEAFTGFYRHLMGHQTKAKNRKHFFYSLPPAFIFLSVIIISGITPGLINGIDPLKISQFPYYLLVYMHHHITAQLLSILGLINFYSQHEQLKKKLRVKVCDTLDQIKGHAHQIFRVMKPSLDLELQSCARNRIVYLGL